MKRKFNIQKNKMQMMNNKNNKAEQTSIEQEMVVHRAIHKTILLIIMDTVHWVALNNF
jgi:hypothetical protein